MVRKLIIVGLTMLAVATGVIAVASTRRSMNWDKVMPTRFVYVRVKDAYLTVVYVTGYDPIGIWMSAETHRHMQRIDWPQYSRFKWRRPLPDRGYPELTRDESEISLPLWAPFLLFAAYPVFAVVRSPLRRWRRKRRGCCMRCGYNLTGNVSGVCPECGARATHDEVAAKCERDDAALSG